jgi:hypothetical protein
VNVFHETLQDNEIMEERPAKAKMIEEALACLGVIGVHPGFKKRRLRMHSSLTLVG